MALLVIDLEAIYMSCHIHVPTLGHYEEHCRAGLYCPVSALVGPVFRLVHFDSPHRGARAGRVVIDRLNSLTF